MAKKLNYDGRKLITGFTTSYRWYAYVTPKSPKGGAQKIKNIYNSILIE